MPEYFCDICHGQNGKHRTGCPYYEPEPTCTCTCDLCGADIYLGDRVIRYEGLTAHTDCFLEEYDKEEK